MGVVREMKVFLLKGSGRQGAAGLVPRKVRVGAGAGTAGGEAGVVRGKKGFTAGAFFGKPRV